MKINKCDKCQRLGRSLRRDEIPLVSINPSLPFKIWAIDFIGPFPKKGKRTSVRCITTTIKYLTKWAKAEPIKTCTKEVVAKFIYQNIITRFGCPLKIISDQGTPLQIVQCKY
jgi:hypothetical protein